MGIREELKEQILQELDRAEERLEAFLAAAPGAIDFLLENARWYGLPLPDVVKDQIRRWALEALEEYEENAREAIAIGREFAEALTSSATLRAAAATISSGPLAATAELKERMTPSALQATDHDAWSSAAGDSYGDVLPDQLLAVDSIEDAGSALARILEDFAGHIENFEIDLLIFAAGLAATVGGLVVAAATFETVVGAIIGLVFAIIGLITAIISGIRLFMASASTTAGYADDLRGLPAIDWPRPLFAQ